VFRLYIWASNSFLIVRGSYLFVLDHEYLFFYEMCHSNLKHNNGFM
jgi:hypothetical protein